METAFGKDNYHSTATKPNNRYPASGYSSEYIYNPSTSHNKRQDPTPLDNTPRHFSPTLQFQYPNLSKYNMLTNDEFDYITTGHKNQIQNLVGEMQRLEVMLMESERSKKLEVQRVRDQYENLTHLQLSNLRQSQFNEVGMVEAQLRKLKEDILTKQEECERVESQKVREKEFYEKEQERLKNEVKILIQKKNRQISELQIENEKKLHKIQEDTNNQINDIKYVCDKQIYKVTKSLDQTSGELQKYKSQLQRNEKQHDKHVTNLEKEREELVGRYEERINEYHERHAELRASLNNTILEINDRGDQNVDEIVDVFKAESEKLLRLINLKDEENNRLKLHLDAQILSFALEHQTFYSQNEHLKQRLSSEKQNQMQETELLKRKVAALHQTDIQNLVSLYEIKIKHLSSDLQRSDNQVSKLKHTNYQQSEKRYEMKKKYDVVMADLNTKVMKMRLGLNNMESEFKEKLDNEKSMMLMTSKSFIKDNEIKSSNNKFLEEEIRKLRQLMDLQNKENDYSQRAIEDKINTANSELERLSNKIVEISKEKKQAQKEYESIIETKQKQIEDLKYEIKNQQIPVFDPSPYLKEINDLKNQKKEKIEESAILKDKIIYLESYIKQMKAELEKFQLESNINQEQAKKHYHTISEHNLQQYKVFYQDRIDSLEKQKIQTKKLLNSKDEQITQLIKKHKELESEVKVAIEMIKKRTQLQTKVINVGMDTNLIRNLVSILPDNDN